MEDRKARARGGVIGKETDTKQPGWSLLSCLGLSRVPVYGFRKRLFVCGKKGKRRDIFWRRRARVV